MKRKIQFALLTALCLSCSVTFSNNEDHYRKGWEAFNRNNRKEAREYFKMATSGNEPRTEAYLCLALLDWNDFNENGAFDHFRQFYEKSDNPYPYLYAFYSMLNNSSGQVLPKDQLQFYQGIVNDPKMNGTLKSMVYRKLGDHYFYSNNMAKAKECYDKIGFLREWQVLGSFDNISGSGFNKDWGALSKSRNTDVFSNKVEADIRWYTPPANKPDGWFYFDYYFPLDNIIAYAQTFVNSDQEQEVYLRAGTSGSLKIWINDVLVASVPEERNCDIDIYGYKIKLNEGANRILVQIGQSEISNANFLIRLTDENGIPLTGITQSGNYADYRKSEMQSLPEMLPFFAETYFEEKIRVNPEELLYYIALGETYLRNDKAYEGTHILKKAEKFAPVSSFVSHRLSEAYSRGNNNIDYSREIENIKQNDPDAFIALRHLYTDAVASEKYSEAETIAEKIKNLYGESYITDAMDIYTASVQHKTEEFMILSRKMYTKYPHNYEFMNLNFAIEEELFNNNKAATKILENYCKKYFSTQALEKLAYKYMNTGKTDKALSTLRKRNETMPYACGYLYSYATLLQRMQRYHEALAVLEDIKKIAPYMSQIYNTEGYIHKDMKNTEKAKEAFRKSIYYGPTSYDSRNQLRLLENKKEVFDLFPKIELGQLIAGTPVAADYPEDNAIIVLYDNQLVFYPEGAKEIRTEIAVKILNQSGIEEWKEYNIAYGNNSQKLLLDKYEVIKANGQRVKAETDYRNRIVFPNLEVGDVLHLEYRLQDYQTGTLSKHFSDWALMQYGIPVMYTRFALLAPADKEFQYLVKNGQIEPFVTDIEQMKLYEWVVDSIQPAIKSEPYMSPFTDIAPMLIISSIPDWQFISNWYKDLTSNKINIHSDYVLQETLSEILRGKEDATQMEKAKLFYEYILNNITYSNVSFLQSNFIPQKASRTIITRLGDCKDVSTLFVALCREVGIEANLVLFQSKENGKNTTALPSVNFNHCIARLVIDNEVYYLELTNNKLPFGTAVESALGSSILPIPYKNETIGDKLLVMEMPSRKPNELIRNKQISCQNNDMKVKSGNIMTGEWAAFARYVYENMGQEDRLKSMNEDVSAKWKNPVKVSDLTFSNLDNLSDSVSYQFHLEAKDALQDVANMKVFKLPWTEAVESLSMVSSEKRNSPFEFWAYVYCDTEKEEIVFTLPENKQLVEIPENTRLECAVATYELTFDYSKKGELRATRTFTKLKEVVSPEEYPEFKSFLNSVNLLDNKQYAIK